MKRAESRWGCCVGADGAIFAMRRALYRTLRDDDINDFVFPLKVIEQGYQCVFDEDAFCPESRARTSRASSSASRESPTARCGRFGETHVS